MDMLSFLDRERQRVSGFPTATIGPNHPLADPNRPHTGSDENAARSLFLHYQETLTQGPPAENPLWHALKTQASAIRMDQGVEAPLAPPAPIPMPYGNVARLLVDASLKRSLVDSRIDEAMTGTDRDAAKATIHATAVERSFNPGIPGQDPTDPNLRRIWESPTGVDYRNSLSEIATAAKTFTARERAQQAHDGRAEVPDARSVYGNLIGSMPTAKAPTGARWTNEYNVKGRTGLESDVTRAFVDMAMRAVDEGRDPTPEQIRTDIGELRTEFSRPKVVTRVAEERSTIGFGPDGNLTVGDFVRPTTYEQTVRPGIAGLDVDGARRQPTAETGRRESDAERMNELRSAHAWPLAEPREGSSREDQIKANAARLAVATLMPDRTLGAAVIDGYDSIGDALKTAGTPGTGAAAHGLHQATRDRVAYARAINAGLAHAEAAAARQNTLLTDPRDPLVAMNGMASGFSTPAARDAAQGSRIAIVGDERPLGTAETEQINRVVWQLAETYGRDRDGNARMRINTTLTPGVGEAVMEAALRHRVPVEAIGHKDDLRFERGSDDERLLALASRLKQAGLGGTWTLHKAATIGRDVPDTTSSRNHAMEAALTTSDAIVAGRMGKDDVATLITASAGQDKPLFALPATGPNPERWSGTQALAKPDNSITLLLERDAGSRSWRDSVIVGAEINVAKDSAIAATIRTGAGAIELRRSLDMETVAEAARGQRDAHLGRGRQTADAEKAAQGVRYEVMANIDYERIGDATYVRSLALKPQEKAAASLLHGNLLVQQGIEGLQDGRGNGRPDDLRRLVETARNATTAAPVHIGARDTGNER